MQEYTAILSGDPSGDSWTAFCPAMPGALAEAPSRDGALAALADVMAGWISLAHADGHQPLDESPSLVARAVAETLEDRAEEGWDLIIETVLVRPRSLAAV